MQRIKPVNGHPHFGRDPPDRAIAQARRFKYNEVLRGAPGHPFAQRWLGIWQAFAARLGVKDIDPFLGKVDANKGLCHSEILSMSSCSSGTCNRSGWSVQPVAA